MSAAADAQGCDNIRLRLRQAFGSFTTGVTVVTSRDKDGSPIGFTANSFTSVSLSPPLLLICLAKSSSNIEHFSNAARFAVNILGENQREISSRFASRVEDRFDGVTWREGVEKTPLLDGTVAWFDCAAVNRVEAGDHLILIGAVTEFGYSDQRPLAYLRGHYLDLGLAEEAVNAVSHHGGVRMGCVLDFMGRVLLRKSENGWSLPMGEVRAGFREGRAALKRTLTQHGVSAEMGFLYSVFDAPSGNATWMIFLGELEEPVEASNLKLFDVEDLPLQEIEARQIRAVLRRYQVEYRQARFGLYIDDHQDLGKINPIDRSATTWSNYMAGQEGSS